MGRHSRGAGEAPAPLPEPPSRHPYAPRAVEDTGDRDRQNYRVVDVGLPSGAPSALSPQQPPRYGDQPSPPPRRGHGATRADLAAPAQPQRPAPETSRPSDPRGLPAPDPAALGGPRVGASDPAESRFGGAPADPGPPRFGATRIDLAESRLAAPAVDPTESRFGGRRADSGESRFRAPTGDPAESRFGGGEPRFGATRADLAEPRFGSAADPAQPRFSRSAPNAGESRVGGSAADLHGPRFGGSVPNAGGSRFGGSAADLDGPRFGRSAPETGGSRFGGSPVDARESRFRAPAADPGEFRFGAGADFGGSRFAAGESRLAAPAEPALAPVRADQGEPRFGATRLDLAQPHPGQLDDVAEPRFGATRLDLTEPRPGGRDDAVEPRFGATRADLAESVGSTALAPRPARDPDEVTDTGARRARSAFRLAAEPDAAEHDEDEHEHEPALLLQWGIFVAQTLTGAIAGLGVWLGFYRLWSTWPFYAVPAVGVTAIGMLVLARTLRRRHGRDLDLLTAVVTAVVITVLTVLPAAFALQGLTQ